MQSLRNSYDKVKDFVTFVTKKSEIIRKRQGRVKEIYQENYKYLFFYQ
jgi:hypothetical protein